MKLEQLKESAPLVKWLNLLTRYTSAQISILPVMTYSGPVYRHLISVGKTLEDHTRYISVNARSGIQYVETLDYVRGYCEKEIPTVKILSIHNIVALRLILDQVCDDGDVSNVLSLRLGETTHTLLNRPICCDPRIHRVFDKLSEVLTPATDFLGRPFKIDDFDEVAWVLNDRMPDKLGMEMGDEVISTLHRDKQGGYLVQTNMCKSTDNTYSPHVRRSMINIWTIGMTLAVMWGHPEEFRTTTLVPIFRQLPEYILNHLAMKFGNDSFIREILMWDAPQSE